MTIYYVTSLFRRMLVDYIKNGTDAYFTIVITNDDPTSTIGRQTVALHNCNIDSMSVAQLDTEAPTLEEELSFTFDDVDLLEEFSTPENL